MFSERLKKLRAEKDISLKALAKEIGTTNATLCRYENNMQRPRQDFIENLADYFEVTTDYLLGRSNYKYFSENETIAIKSNGKISDDDMKMLRTLIDRLVEEHKDKDK